MNLIKKCLLIFLVVFPTMLLAEARLQNLATRGFIGTGDNVLIGGLIITGDAPKTILIRARGPALTVAGVVGAISDTEILLFSGSDIIDRNDDWQTHENANQVPVGLQPTDSRESVIVKTLVPGGYTAIVTGINGEEGIGLVEIFELSNTGITKLANIATRGFVGTDDAVMIGGLVISGDENKTLLIRAKGPSLTAQGVDGALANPEIILLSGQTVIDSNTDWKLHARFNEIPTELQPTDDLEAALITELAPGPYTAIVTGTGGTTGVGIVEVFEVIPVTPPVEPRAQAFFTDNIETSIIQSSCITCHVPGGIAGNTNLLFETTNPTSDVANYQQFEAFVGTSISVQNLVLSKVSGNNHGGGNQLPFGSAGYNDLESFLNLLTNNVSPPTAPSEFFAAVNLQPRASTLRKAAIMLAGRLPTSSEIDQVTDDASLKFTMRNLMQGSAFHEFLLDGVNDRLLIRGILSPAFLDECFKCFPVYTNHLHDLFVADPEEGRREGNAFRFKGRIGLVESPLELVAFIVENDFPYTEILTANYMMLNPTANFSVEGTAVFDNIDDVYEFKPGVMTGYYRPGPGTVVEEFEGSGFFKIVDPGDLKTNYPHAGILNSHAFLSRYPTTATNRNRARARWAFLHFLDVDIELSAERTNDPVALADTNNPTLNNDHCTVCHSTMDPVAGAFQNYDETGLYRSNYGGLDSLDNFYKFGDETESSLYQFGDTWYKDMLNPGYGTQAAPSADNSLQWLSQHITSDEGFSRAAVKFWWPSLMGKEVLLSPQVLSDANYDAKLAAFEAQAVSIQSLSDQFSANGMLLKDLLLEMMMTSWFRAESVDPTVLTANLKSAHLIADLGDEVLLTPERLQLKTKDVAGFNWRASNTEIEKQRTGFKDTYNLYYGGIDSSAITKRATELTPLMSTVAMAHSLESACPIVLREFILPDGNRKLFNGIDELTTPLTTGLSSASLTTNTNPNFTDIILNVDLKLGQNRIDVNATDGFCDYDEVSNSCLSQNSLLLDHVNVLRPGESTPVTFSVKEENIQADNSCSYFFENNRIILYGQCTVSIPLDVASAGSYTITASLAGFKQGADHVNTNEIMVSLGIESLAPAISAQTSGADLIKQKLIDLHSLMLGKTYSVDSAEITTAYQLFVESWEERQLDPTGGNLFNAVEACDWFSDTDYTVGLGLDTTQEDAGFYTELFQKGADSKNSKQAWVTVITYLMTHYHYLHE